MPDEEKKEYEELKSLLYTGTISQYGKRKLIDIIEKQSKEIEELKEENEKYKNPPFFDEDKYTENDKIKAKIEELEDMYNKLPKNPKEHLHSKTEYKIVIGEMQSLLEKE